MRVLLVALVTLLIGGIVVGFVLFRTASPDVAHAPGARELGTFFAQEHQAASRAQSHDDFEVKTEEDVRIQTGAWLGRQMEFDETLFASESGLRFIGARESQVPGMGRSAHLLFVTEGDAWASLFLQQYRGYPELDQNTSYSINASGLGRDAPSVVVWRPGGQIYFLVSERPEGVAALRSALDIPEPSQRYR